jgi:TetR/AcrR family transcriptional regulator, transcriptional repressor for nem operon
MNLKDKIIHDSLNLFSKKGFLSTSISDILEKSGTSKGGFYNHFKSKEDLFIAVLSEARKIWRERNLAGIDQIDRPVEKIIKLLENYRDRYLKDSLNFPGGCIFVTLSVELDDLRPHLGQELHQGFTRLKTMIRRLLDQAKDSGELKTDVSTEDVTEMIFSGILGASVMYGTDKSTTGLDRTMEALITYLRKISTL